MALGIVLNPHANISPRYIYGEPLDPQDPQHYRSGEAGYYYDTALGRPRLSWWRRAKAKLGLGMHPTDFEIASMYNYQPVMSSQPTGLGEGTPATVESVLAEMNAHNARVFSLSLISTAAVTVSAMISIFRTLKLIKDDKH